MAATYARDTQHNPDAFWTGTAKPLFGRVMASEGYKSFDDIVWEDLEADNAVVMMSDFVNRCGANPPISPHTNRPYAATTLVDALSHIIRQLKLKFRTQLLNQPEMFPEDEVKGWKKQLTNNRNRTLMEGLDETEVLKSCFPIPREHTGRTLLFRYQDFPDASRREANRNTDLLSIGKWLFGRDRYTELAQVLMTHDGVGRGGEVKFLNYKSWMMDET